jgi:hypothetical protein
MLHLFQTKNHAMEPKPKRLSQSEPDSESKLYPKQGFGLEWLDNTRTNPWKQAACKHRVVRHTPASFG